MLKMAPTPPLKPPLSERDHILGVATAPITLVEYGDYQCPHCRLAYGIVGQFRERYGDKIRFGYRHFPLAKMHPQARLAAEVAEAAAAQGKFWEMHGLIFENADKIALDDLLQHAADLSLDTQRIRTEVETHLYAPRVQEDLSSGVRSGVNATPTFFINDIRHNGGYAREGLAAAFDLILAG